LHIRAVTLVVPDYDAGIAFYVGQIGFAVVADTDMGGGRRWVLVAPPGGQTALLLARAADAGQTAAIEAGSGHIIEEVRHSA